MYVLSYIFNRNLLKKRFDVKNMRLHLAYAKYAETSSAYFDQNDVK